MKLRKIISLCLVGAMTASLLTACGTGVTEEENTDNAGDVSVSENAGSGKKFDELQTIEGYGMSFYGDAGFAEVQDAINEITVDAINVEFNYHPMDVATYMEQIGLMLSGGEAFDLVMCTAIPVVSFSTMQSQNQLLDITDYLDEYAPELVQTVGDYIDATTVDEKVYGVPNYKMYNSNYYIFMRKDILDYLNLTEKARSCETWTQVEEILYAVKDAQETLPAELQTNAIICNSDAQGCVISDCGWNSAPDKFSEGVGMEILANSTKLIYVDENNKVQNYFATDDYRTTVERVHKWYQDGLVYKDSATSDKTGDTLMSDGITFAYITQAELGAEEAKTVTTGHEVVAVEYGQIPVQSYNVNAWAWAVPVTSENPEAAVAFLNEMYTNPDIENLLVYGIEGRDYELNDEGEAVRSAELEYQCEDFLFGNQFNAYPAAGNGSDFRERAMKSMQEAVVSPYYGCVVDTDPIANELTAISNVLAKYEPGLESGSTDMATLDAMLSELESSGLQVVLDHYQKTLDEWLANQ